MTDERITWHKQYRDAREDALDTWAWHVANGQQVDGFDESHEYADNHECVIYYHKARTLFDDSFDVRNYEIEAVCSLPDTATIDERIARCVYIALQRAFDDAMDELDALDIPEEDALDGETLEAWALRAGREALGIEAKA